MELKGTSFLGLQRGSSTGRCFRAVDPARHAELDPDFICAPRDDVDRAVGLAHDAEFDYRSFPGADRARFLRSIAARLSAHAPNLIDRACQETGLPTGRIDGELTRTTGQLELFAKLVEEGSWIDARIDLADPDRAPLPKPDLRSMLRPVGPVAVFGASNFPLAFSVAGGDTASALAAGCPVVFKAHPAHPGTCEIAGSAVLEAASRCGLPDGVFSLLFDDGHEIGAALVQHPQIRAVAFTGSRGGGRALMGLAAARKEPIPVFAEMGSVNPVFILPGAMAERGEEIARGLHASLTLGAGQFCTNPGLVIALRDTGTELFLAALSERIRSTDLGPMLSASICANFRAGLKSTAMQPGVELLATAAAHDPENPTSGPAALLSVDARSFLENTDLMEEVFGPSTLVVQCEDGPEILAMARALEGQLTATLHAQEDEFLEARTLIATLESKAGRLVYGGFPTGVEVGHAMVHGGPYPATSDGQSSSVGTRAIFRFVRPVCFQDFPDAALPTALQRANPERIWRRIDGSWVAPNR